MDWKIAAQATVIVVIFIVTRLLSTRQDKSKQCEDCKWWFTKEIVSSLIPRFFVGCQNPDNNARNDYKCEKSKQFYKRKWWKLGRPK